MPAGLTALIVGLQPVLTAFLAARVAEQVSAKQWAGLFLGLAGVAIVLAQKLGFEGVTLVGLLLAVIALCSFTAGTLYQKILPDVRFASGDGDSVCRKWRCDHRPDVVFEPIEVQWTWPLVGALLWSILPLSIGAMSLWFVLLRQGAATRVSSLMYLTPPTVAIMAWWLFGEALTLWVMTGHLGDRRWCMVSDATLSD